MPIGTNWDHKEETMQKITFFYLQYCPYCRKAEQAFAALKQENPAYAAGKEKIYEAHPGDDYDTIKAHVKKALDAALA